MTIFARVYVDEDVDILVATFNKSHAGILIAKRRNPYEITERVAILVNTLTADEIANQLLYF